MILNILKIVKKNTAVEFLRKSELLKNKYFEINKKNILKANKKANKIRKKYNINIFDNNLISEKNLYYCEINKENNNIIFHFLYNNKRKIIKINNKKLLEIYEDIDYKVYNKTVNVEINNINFKKNSMYPRFLLLNNNMLLEYAFFSINNKSKITDIYYLEKNKTNIHIVSDKTFKNKYTKSWLRYDFINNKIILYEIKKISKEVREIVYYYKLEDLSKPYKKIFALN